MILQLSENCGNLSKGQGAGRQVRKASVLLRRDLWQMDEDQTCP